MYVNESGAFGETAGEGVRLDDGGRTRGTCRAVRRAPVERVRRGRGGGGGGRTCTRGKSPSAAATQMFLSSVIRDRGYGEATGKGNCGKNGVSERMTKGARKICRATRADDLPTQLPVVRDGGACCIDAVDRSAAGNKMNTVTVMRISIGLLPLDLARYRHHRSPPSRGVHTNAVLSVLA